MHPISWMPLNQKFGHIATAICPHLMPKSISRDWTPVFTFIIKQPLKYIIVSLMLICIGGTIHAEREKIRILVNRFGRNGNSYVSGSYQTRLKNTVAYYLNTSRFEIIEGSDRYYGDVVDTSEIDYVVDGSFIDLKHSTKQEKDCDREYIATGTAMVTCTRTSDNVAIVSAVVTDDASSYDSYDDAEERLIGGLAGQLCGKIQKKFVERDRISEITEAKDNEAKEFIAELGHEDDVYKGKKLVIVQKREVRGRTIFHTVGEAKALENIGNDKFLCKVTKGHKEIYRLYLDDPESLYIQTEKQK